MPDVKPYPPLTQRMVNDLEELYRELEDRYDGAPDSGSRWMAEHLYNLRWILEQAKRRPA